MEVRDGFIIGISNYCDSWCTQCAFTARCQVFADLAEYEATLDPGLKALVEAPLLSAETPPPPPRWLQEQIDEMNEIASQPMPADEIERLRPKVAPEYGPIRRRSDEYCERVHAWLRRRTLGSADDPSDPRSVVAWFHTLIPAKVVRALKGLASDEPELRDWPADHDGSAKMALIGIDRSHAAWLEIVDRGLASRGEVEPFVAGLIWLGVELEEVFPNARAFVRPAFDEPDEVARMVAEEGGL